MNKVALTVLVLVLLAAASYAFFFRDSVSPAIGKDVEIPTVSTPQSTVNTPPQVLPTSEPGPPALE